MFSTKQLFSFLFIAFVVLALHLTEGIPVDSDASDETNSFLDESRFSKRRLPVEGILIGRRGVSEEGVVAGKNYPTEGILIGKRYPTEGILLGKRYPTEGILLGKRYPTEGILLGKRNSRFLQPKFMHENPFEK